MVQDTDPWGDHTKICIEYYRDYGETLVGTYCHDLHKNYGKTCEAVNDLAAEKCGNSCVLLSWSEPESSLPVVEYWVYRRVESRNKNYELRITNYELRCIRTQRMVSYGFRISGFGLRATGVEVFDIYGRNVGTKLGGKEERQPESDGVVLDISHLHSGIYFLKITTDQGTIMKKIVKN